MVAALLYRQEVTYTQTAVNIYKVTTEKPTQGVKYHPPLFITSSIERLTVILQSTSKWLLSNSNM